MEVFEGFYKEKRPVGPILASLVEAAWLSHLPMVGATFVSGRTERCTGAEVTAGSRRHHPICPFSSRALSYSELVFLETFIPKEQ